ncbi:transposase [Acidocella sp.]|uniref:IS110 family transposase n=1 Tax=Acidocella sp. TaxID=50710 RepID=UPI0025C6EF52|nr:transposase [Acidocella sp.]
MGHRVKLIRPQYVNTFVKRNKNDRNDAEALSEAASRPSMRTVPVKTVNEQAATIVVKHREMMVGQRTQAINSLRGHAAAFGVIAAKGSGNADILLSTLADHPAIPDMANSPTT